MPLTYIVPQHLRVASAPVDPADLSGEDISLRGGDFVVTPAGDWAAISKTLAARQSVEREAVASPGDFPRRPEWGMGLRDGLMRNSSQDIRDRQTSAARRRLAANPRIGRVRSVEVKARTDIPNATVVTIDADVSGQQISISTTITPRVT